MISNSQRWLPMRRSRSMQCLGRTHPIKQGILTVHMQMNKITHWLVPPGAQSYHLPLDPAAQIQPFGKFKPLLVNLGSIVRGILIAIRAPELKELCNAFV
jgi:hypothetical protein